ncbi:MAG TPA: hypothetical protein VMO17_10685 [Terriglobia bacterium]|nr:hypothetical protein [Terriglobia bacterium]
MPIEAEAVESQSPGASGRVGAFFSGGVDSFFTLLRHEGRRADVSSRPVQDLLCIWGFDIPLSNPEAFARLRSTMRSVANGFGKELIDVATNLRETRLNQADWSHHYHGSALASVGFALEKRYQTLFIASSTYSYNRFAPWGSHPMIDHLLSTRNTRVVHDGAGHSRLEKTRLIAESNAAVQVLRVCWRDHSDANCGKCSKCYRTMLELELVGALSRCGTFPSTTLDLSQVRNLYVQGREYRVLFNDIRSYAESVGRNDVVNAIDRSLKSSARIDAFLDLTGRLAGKVIPWRARDSIKRRLLANKIT